MGLRKSFPIRREQALAIFHNRYRPSLVRSFKITDTLPEDYRHVPGDRDILQFLCELLVRAVRFDL